MIPDLLREVFERTDWEMGETNIPICMRIGSFQPRPLNVRMLSCQLSDQDMEFTGDLDNID
jgi:hypothetical protein